MPQTRRDAGVITHGSQLPSEVRDLHALVKELQGQLASLGAEKQDQLGLAEAWAVSRDRVSVWQGDRHLAPGDWHVPNVAQQQRVVDWCKQNDLLKTETLPGILVRLEDGTHDLTEELLNRICSKARTALQRFKLETIGSSGWPAERSQDLMASDQVGDGTDLVLSTRDNVVPLARGENLQAGEITGDYPGEQDHARAPAVASAAERLREDGSRALAPTQLGEETPDEAPADTTGNAGDAPAVTKIPTMVPRRPSSESDLTKVLRNGASLNDGCGIEAETPVSQRRLGQRLAPDRRIVHRRTHSIPDLFCFSWLF